MGSTRRRPEQGPSPNGDFASGWEPLSAVADEAFAGASMVDSAASGVQAFANGTLGAAPSTELAGFPAGLPSPGLDPSPGGSPDAQDWPASESWQAVRGRPNPRASQDSHDDEELGLDSPGVEDPGWSAGLRAVGRVGAWALPVGAIGLVVTALWSWPQPGIASNRPGTWLVITAGSFAFALLGVLSITALVVPTPGRRWAVSGATSAVLGSLLLAPILGVVALARPAVTNAALGKSAASLQTDLMDGTVARWLLVGGLTLLAVGVALLGIAVLASSLLARMDGYLLLASAGLAVFAAWAAWQPLLVIAAVVLLAAGLGLAWTAAHVTLDGHGPDLTPD